jgi:hypothetical protein
MKRVSTRIGLIILAALPTLATIGHAELTTEWVTRLPVGSSLSAGISAFTVDPAVVSYVTGISGSSSNTDITTAAIAPDGSLIWSQTFDGPEAWHDQSRGIAVSNGIVYVTGNTPGPSFFSQVLVVTYNAVTGAPLNSFQYTSGPGTAEFGSGIVVDGLGNMFVGGGTVGDGSDAMVLKLDPAGQLIWKRTWDGPSSAPFSLDVLEKVMLDGNGDVVVLLHGVMSSLHPDYVVVKYDPLDGSTMWESNWGVTGGDFPRDMEIDAADDIYVTGIGIDLIDKYSTVKLSGGNGSVLWQEYDANGFDHAARGLALDGDGNVLVTGTSDPDGDNSNFNDQFFTVKRDGQTGALLWTHTYGDTCVGCFDAPADVAVDTAGNAFVSGSSSSAPFSGDVLLLALDNNTGLEVDRGSITGTGSEHAGSSFLRFDSAFNLYDGGGTNNFDTGSVEMSVAKWPSLAGGGNDIACGDVLRFQARCIAGGAGNRLQFRVTLTDGSHDGEPVTVTVDGEPFVLNVAGGRAQMSINGALPGAHTLELSDPVGCFPPVERTCPGG